MDDLVRQIDEPTLAAIRRPWGSGTRRVGGNAEKILRMAQALATGQEILIAPPRVPECSNYVMFDLEGGKRR
jgi:hypothetical protein